MSLRRSFRIICLLKQTDQVTPLSSHTQVFLLLPPTLANLSLLEAWATGGEKEERFLPLMGAYVYGSRCVCEVNGEGRRQSVYV